EMAIYRAPSPGFDRIIRVCDDSFPFDSGIYLPQARSNSGSRHNFPQLSQGFDATQGSPCGARGIGIRGRRRRLTGRVLSSAFYYAATPPGTSPTQELVSQLDNM